MSNKTFPSITTLKKYWSLVIIESDPQSNPRLPASLLPANSDYFGKIMFILVGSPSSNLIGDFKLHMGNENYD